jgi:hypothetical protein
LIQTRGDVRQLREQVRANPQQQAGESDDPGGVRTSSGRLILGPGAEGNGENRLAVSLAVGLQRSDGLLFGEFARQRMVKLCPSAQLTDFARVWAAGQPNYSITLGVADGANEEPGCPGTAVVAEVDWTDAAVTAPSDDNKNGQPMPWLDDFRRGDPA